MDVGNLISGSSAFSKSCLYVWKFSVHILLKPSLKGFEHYFASNVKWKQLRHSLNILWHCLSLGLEWNWPFLFLWPLLSLPNFLACWLSTFPAWSFRILNSSTEIPSPPLDLFLVMLPKAHLTSYSRMSGSRLVITPSWFSGPWTSFLYSFSVYSCTSS